MTIILFLIGFVLLIKGADYLVEGSASIAEKYGVPEIVIGLTIVAFGTSAPELIVNIIASIQGNSEIAVGNVLGSNMANVLLILGCTALIATIKVEKTTFAYEIPFSLAVTGLLFALATNLGSTRSVYGLSRLDGGILILVFFGFWWYTWRLMKKGQAALDPDDIPTESQSLPRSLVKVFAGVLGLFLGGKWLVDGAVSLASVLGVTEGLIGVTVVAVGTSLPELAASIAAARKNKMDFVMGNVVGSNIFNILWVLGASATIRPLPYDGKSNLDILAILLSGILLLALFMLNRMELGKKSGGLFILVYLVYVVVSVLVRGEPAP